ncbi:MAG: hypothetical protein FD127_3506, partial [Acidimicrobiaceae bacterium]
MILVLVVQGGAFKRCCMLDGNF